MASLAVAMALLWCCYGSFLRNSANNFKLKLDMVLIWYWLLINTFDWKGMRIRHWPPFSLPRGILSRPKLKRRLMNKLIYWLDGTIIMSTNWFVWPSSITASISLGSYSFTTYFGVILLHTMFLPILGYFQNHFLISHIFGILLSLQ